MTLRCVSGALTAGALTCATPMAGTAQAQTRDASLLPPDQSGIVTVAGCLKRGEKDGDKEKYILATPKLGPIANVPIGTCEGPADYRMLELKDAEANGVNAGMIGRWVEINGELERETDSDLTNLRELEVRSARVVPVLPPPRAEVRPPTPAPASASASAPPPAAPPAAAPEPAPVATTGEVAQELPRTASFVPAAGLLGLLSLAAGLGLRTYRTRKRG
jgi:hypothetical protein